MAKFRVAVEITEHDDGSISAQQLHLDGPLSNLYGRFLGPGQVAKLGMMLLSRSELFVTMTGFDERPKEPEPTVRELSDLERARKAWERKKSKLTPKVYAKFGAECQECGTDEDLTIDHIKPLAKGGTNTLDNLQPLCKSCNSRKRDTYDGE